MKTIIFFCGMVSLISICACELKRFESIDAGPWSQATLLAVAESMKGSVDSNIVGKMESIALDVAQQNIVLSLPVPELSFLNGWKKDVNGVSGASLRGFMGKNGTSGVQLVMPLMHLLQTNSSQERRNLPTGDSIPFIGGVLLNSVEVVVPNTSYKFVVYFGFGAAAVFAQVPYDTYRRISVPVRGVDIDDVIGYVSTVPKTSVDGGIILTVKIPDSVIKVLKQR